MLRIRAFLEFGWGWGLELLLVSCRIFEPRRRLESIMRDLLSLGDEGVLLWVVVILQREGLELLRVRGTSIEGNTGSHD